MIPEFVLSFINLAALSVIFYSVLSHDRTGIRLNVWIRASECLILVGTGVPIIEIIFHQTVEPSFFRVLANIGLAISLYRNGGNLAQFFNAFDRNTHRTDP